MARRKKSWWTRVPPFSMTVTMGEAIGVSFLTAVVTTIIMLNVLSEAQLGDAMLPIFVWMPLSVHPLWWVASLVIWPDWPYFWNLLLFNQLVTTGAVLAAMADGVWGTATTRAAFETRSFQVEGLLWIVLGGGVVFGLCKWFLKMLWPHKGTAESRRRRRK